jgi:hypothetical protein
MDRERPGTAEFFLLFTKDNEENKDSSLTGKTAGSCWTLKESRAFR